MVSSILLFVYGPCSQGLWTQFGGFICCFWDYCDGEKQYHPIGGSLLAIDVKGIASWHRCALWSCMSLSSSLKLSSCHYVHDTCHYRGWLVSEWAHGQSVLHWGNHFFFAGGGGYVLSSAVSLKARWMDPATTGQAAMKILFLLINKCFYRIPCWWRLRAIFRHACCLFLWLTPQSLAFTHPHMRDRYHLQLVASANRTVPIQLTSVQELAMLPLQALIDNKIYLWCSLTW